MSVHYHSHLQPIAARYDAFILDLWGVIHDGQEIYQGAIATLKALRDAGKRVIFLSNAPRRAEKVMLRLDQLGISRELYETVFCSGEAAHDYFSRIPALSYYYLGPERDANVMDGLPHVRVEKIEEAHCIVNTGHPNDDPSINLDPLLKIAITKHIPLVCLNPDMEIVTIKGERHACAGVVAERYEDLGGSAAYFGKPYDEVYHLCLQHFAAVPKAKILCIGDSLITDIAGAEQVGLKSAIVTGGILKEELGAADSPHVLQENVTRYAQTHDIMPDYAIPGFIW